MHAHLCKHFFLYMNVQLCSIGARLCVCAGVIIQSRLYWHYSFLQHLTTPSTLRPGRSKTQQSIAVLWVFVVTATCDP